ncbi:hypothetical protein M6B38_315715 [Iris pallida]|uniref:Uncharacterized protein n=1 Tax=Iris pallida TaxID=29817 RepID=A0AAX6HF03_IRIPA|nr:hypothetical protein M6B38_315715 [Iris pallida]
MGGVARINLGQVLCSCVRCQLIVPDQYLCPVFCRVMPRGCVRV